MKNIVKVLLMCHSMENLITPCVYYLIGSSVGRSYFGCKIPRPLEREAGIPHWPGNRLVVSPLANPLPPPVGHRRRLRATVGCRLGGKGGPQAITGTKGSVGSRILRHEMLVCGGETEQRAGPDIRRERMSLRRRRRLRPVWAVPRNEYPPDVPVPIKRSSVGWKSFVGKVQPPILS